MTRPLAVNDIVLLRDGRILVIKEIVKKTEAGTFRDESTTHTTYVSVKGFEFYEWSVVGRLVIERLP